MMGRTDEFYGQLDAIKAAAPKSLAEDVGDNKASDGDGGDD